MSKLSFLLKYISAQLYDGCILIALFFAFTALCLLATHGIAIPPATRWYQCSLVAIGIGYYLSSTLHGGQTIGMRAWRLRLTTETDFLRWQQIVKRMVLFIPALFLSLMSWQNPQQILHKWTKTRIVQWPY
ncbi:RDD family [Legionella lansingensis]|uniref:RDD family protein n=1 Tax=Legionella lansingensis TaxID=45067 RepID=A0A0W0VR81_9GAMM|nr:RDD family protein [Legionella lansingensis]KTD22230.1 RDD family protein [Legionella lansingensis]SNV55167.1 RDD family [Legionella lansingensis]